MIYLYNNKLISHQVVKKYFDIKDICELPDMSYWTNIDLESEFASLLRDGNKYGIEFVAVAAVYSCACSSCFP